jgi:hypothetical protein
MVAGSEVVFGDGSDIAMHFIYALLGPLCALAVVQAIPSIFSHLLASAVGASGWAAAPAAAAATATAGVANQSIQGSMVTSGGGSTMHFQPQGGLGRTALSEALGVKPGEKA